MAIVDKINAFTGEHGETIEDSLKNLSEIKKLPEVTAEDNGKVLSVVDGEWAKAEPSGGSDSPNYEFICNIKRDVHYDETIDDDVETWTSDKTYEELYAAYEDSIPFLIKFEAWDGGYLDYSGEFSSYKAQNNPVKEGLIFSKDDIFIVATTLYTEDFPDRKSVQGSLTRLYVYSDGTFEFGWDEGTANSSWYVIYASKSGNVWTLDTKAGILLRELINDHVDVWIYFYTESSFDDDVKAKIISASAIGAAVAEDKRYKFVIYHTIEGPITFEAAQDDDYPTWTES